MEIHFKNLSNESLLTLIHTKVQKERDLTLEVIDLLREIRSRRLHLDRGYSSLHEFCVKELKYSDGAAYRRIKAMELVHQSPLALEAIKEGRLNLTVASQTQNFFEQKAKVNKPLSKTEKDDLLTKMENKTKREAEEILATLSPEIFKVEAKLRPMSSDMVKMELTIDKKLSDKIRRLKDLKPNSTLVEILERLVDSELKRIDPLKDERAKGASPEKLSAAKGPRNPRVTYSQSRYIPVFTKREIWKKDQGQCSFVDSVSKRKCESKKWLQIDHIKPVARGGTNDPDNLRLLCPAHNRHEAMTKIGPLTMGRYLKL